MHVVTHVNLQLRCKPQVVAWFENSTKCQPIVALNLVRFVTLPESVDLIQNMEICSKVATLSSRLGRRDWKLEQPDSTASERGAPLVSRGLDDVIACGGVPWKSRSQLLCTDLKFVSVIGR